MSRSGNRDERLDPIRLRAPSRGTLLRLAAIVTLLGLAVALFRAQPAKSPCATPPAKATTPAKATASGKPSIPDDTVGVPVRLADPTALALVHPGNRVDLLRLDDGGDTTPIATAALVLDVTAADDPTTGGLLLALGAEQAAQAVATTGRGFAILIRPG
ncbi:hypothetical protein GCM10010168_02420 [Actinoplanes ianthinogenes]|uniref:Flp pilus assembly protein RcpC/CpaB domain-containing protein n=1 Tax=Actinoplanes ianthinogenes TaxID=122358 RepID=A0ABM7LUJ1_9ACTN|nr:hypothetical protein [Actinoplanes ianthinogenes]BCJ43016.1 hypothetical protein Aiant_36730 [Actinoplanes ianthinogenes]GGQ90763.1 hypothetical protein GCM10010168_02420 [Actinoplanes ianthinogenes]